MLLIATIDEELAVKIGQNLGGERHYLTRAETEIDLRAKVHAVQPQILILDVRLGGTRYEALSQVGTIIGETRSKPTVIVLTPWERPAVRQVAARLGCFEVLSLRRRSFQKELARVVLEARAARFDASYGSDSGPIVVH